MFFYKKNKLLRQYFTFLVPFWHKKSLYDRFNFYYCRYLIEQGIQDEVYTTVLISTIVDTIDVIAHIFGLYDRFNFYYCR